jgi:hypothetical protein
MLGEENRRRPGKADEPVTGALWSGVEMWHPKFEPYNWFDTKTQLSNALIFIFFFFAHG